jgi:hypothetical protein
MNAFGTAAGRKPALVAEGIHFQVRLLRKT